MTESGHGNLHDRGHDLSSRMGMYAPDHDPASRRSLADTVFPYLAKFPYPKKALNQLFLLASIQEGKLLCPQLQRSHP